MRALRKLFLDGLLVAIPLALLAVLAVYAINFFKDVVQPLVALLPVDSVLGIGLLTLAAIFALVLVILFFGLLVRWRARRFVEWFETKVLNRIPAYVLVKRISTEVVDPDAEDTAVLVDLYGSGARSLGFLVEETTDGHIVVYVPDAPAANSGAVYVVPSARAERIHISGLEAIDIISHRGIGAAKMLASDSPPASSDPPAT